MAEYFDSYEIPADDTSQNFYVAESGRTVTGIPGSGGPQGGTRELRLDRGLRGHREESHESG